MMSTPTEVIDADRVQGHRRNYTRESLIADVELAGLRVVHVRPVFMKLMPNEAMLDWSWEQIRAVHRVAQQMPNRGAEIYLVAEPA